MVSTTFTESHPMQSQTTTEILQANRANLRDLVKLLESRGHGWAAMEAAAAQDKLTAALKDVLRRER